MWCVNRWVVVFGRGNIVPTVIVEGFMVGWFEVCVNSIVKVINVGYYLYVRGYVCRVVM